MPVAPRQHARARGHNAERPITGRRGIPDRVPRLLTGPTRTKLKTEIVMKPCGHTQPVSTCPHCQRAQLARWRRQPVAVTPKSNLTRKES